MKADRGVKNYRISSDGLLDGCAVIPTSSSSFLTTGVHFIEHRVSKMDTLAGVAIKYGVEVADIKRMNGLVTDLQMFAHNSLQIPLPGRHPPSPIMLNGSTQNGEKTPPRRSHYDILDSLQSLNLKHPPRRISPAMCNLQGFYGLTNADNNGLLLPQGTEKKALLFEDQTPPDSPFSRHRKSRSLVNVTSLENGDAAEDIAEPDRSIRRRQRGEESTGGGVSGRGLALRPKPGSRSDGEASRPGSSTTVVDSFGDVFVSVRKSSSASNLTESENGSAVRPASRWSLKGDGISRPIFDGLPKAVVGRRNKAAID